MISIIIPTLNEEGFLRNTVEHTLRVAANPEQLEIIIVDAGSSDQTIYEVEDLFVTSFIKPAFILQKYKSLNFGAAKANANVLLFLDADTFLPIHFDDLIMSKLKHEQVVAGAFEFSFTEPDLKMKILTLINRIRYRFGHVYYGDQAIWVRKSAFEKVGGFPKESLMEAAFLCKNLRKLGKLVLIKKAIKTSPRRFSTYGFFRVTWFDIVMYIRFRLGLPVSTFAKNYWSKNLSGE